MKLGAFVMPSHPPERGIREGFEWDLANLVALDQLGFSEAWIGEHFTAPWEPCPAPDLMIAQARPVQGRSRRRRFRRHAGVPGRSQLVGWIPSSVADKIGELQHTTGGFGSVLVVVYDFSSEQEAWDESLDLLIHEVLPQP